MALPPIPPQLRAESDPSPQAHEERHPSLGQNPFIAQMRCSVRPVPAPEASSQILHPVSPGRQQSRGEPLAGGREGTWQKWGGTGAGHGDVRGCRGGTRGDTIHTTGHTAIRTKIKAIYQEAWAARLPSVHCSEGVRICTPQPPPCTPRLPMTLGINMGDSEPPGAAAE